MVNVHGTREMNPIARNNSGAVTSDNIFLSGSSKLDRRLTVRVNFEEAGPKPGVFLV